LPGWPIIGKNSENIPEEENMLHHVKVSFAKGRDYEFQFSDADLIGLTAEQARRWIENEYTTLECEVASPMGKVLVIDKILSVAKYGGEQRFIDGKDWARSFCRSVALALGRDTVRVDVAEFVIGY
jgi:hypothetical protein